MARGRKPVGKKAMTGAGPNGSGATGRGGLTRLVPSRVEINRLTRQQIRQSDS